MEGANGSLIGVLPTMRRKKKTYCTLSLTYTLTVFQLNSVIERGYFFPRSTKPIRGQRDCSMLSSLLVLVLHVVMLLSV